MPRPWSKLLAYVTRRWISSLSFIGASPVQTTKPPAVERTDGFALSPYVPFFRTASLSCRNRAVKFAAAFTCVPPFRSKWSGTPLVRPRKRTAPRRSSPLFIEHNASLACASKRKLHRYVKQRTDCESCLDNVHTDTVYFL